MLGHPLYHPVCWIACTMSSLVQNASQNWTLKFQQDLDSMKTNANMFFLIIMGAIVFFLKPGFAFYESALVRTKNVTSALFRNFTDVCIGTLAYFLTGYALSFGGGNGFCGTKYFALIDLPEDKYAMCWFQYTFAATATTIPSGVVHERCSMKAYLCYTILLSGLIYPIATHWAAAPEGWLAVLGFTDFAFSGVVHALGGAASLAAVYMVGPRVGHFNPDGSTNRVPPHNVAQGAFGTFLFLFGILAFNAGSQLSIGTPSDGIAIGKILLNTLICMSTSALTAFLHHHYTSDRPEWDVFSAINGSFLGMVVICAECNQIRFWGALLTGVLSFYFFLMVKKLILKLQVDDVVEGIPIHIGGGYFGLISAAIFKEDGLLLNPSRKSVFGLLINAIGGIAIITWSAGIIILLYTVLRRFDLHRVSPAEEKLGLDKAVHDQVAYNFDDVPIGKMVIVCPETASAKSSPALKSLSRRRAWVVTN